MYKLVITIFISISLILLACNQDIDCQGEMVYDTSQFTAEEQSWIQESAIRWNVWTGHTVMTVSPGDRESCSIKKGTITDGHIGEDWRHQNRILIDIDQINAGNEHNAQQFEAYTMHEMGHSLGFFHIGDTDRSALMNHIAAFDFTDLDREECWLLNICLVDQLE